MKTSKLTHILFAGSTFVLAAAAGSIPTPGDLRVRALEYIEPLPERMPGADNDTEDLVRLGRRLYFEKDLSVNRTQSCNSCHQLDRGGAGVDNEPTSPGAFGKRGDRNSPTTLNAALQVAQFWDGRAADLVAQAKGPVLNPVEMAMPAETEVIARLRADDAYPGQFELAFPDAEQPITYDNMARAIAAFERTLITRDRFDDFLKGDDDALETRQLRGLDLFLSKGCVTCHHGPLLGGNSFQKLGIAHPYENQKDPGRQAVTDDESDLLRFKVPTLRNVEATPPYFHDGAVDSLADAVRKMGRLQLGIELADDEIADLSAFLESLTGRGIKRAGQTDVPAGGF